MLIKNEDTKVSFTVFFLLWADRQGWDVPDIHMGICHWLDENIQSADVSDLLLMVFRGCGKSTILGIFNAYLYYRNSKLRLLHQGDQDKTANKCSRDTKHILERHPLTRKIMKDSQGDITFWWLKEGYESDPRNPSMQAAGILSNITSSRADIIQNDDVEVQKNVLTPESREKLRYRLSEQIHIAVPGAKFIWVGTPHCTDSLYENIEKRGAATLKIPLYGKEKRIEIKSGKREYACEFRPDIIFSGIGKHARLVSFTWKSGVITLPRSVKSDHIDAYANPAWPERFDSKEMLKRRKQCNTHNEWDSQYQLHAKPISLVRLNPERLVPYKMEPVIKIANRQTVMFLGQVRLTRVVGRFDPALGKVDRDRSVFTVLFSDDAGNQYIHKSQALYGDVFEQAKAIKKICVALQCPRVDVETNGIGGHVPAVLRRELEGTGVSVTEIHSSENKNKRIMDAWESPLSAGVIWAHVDVLEGGLWDEMTNYNPKVTKNDDDHLDSGAGAIRATPVIVGQMIEISNKQTVQNWRPNTSQFEVTVER